MLVPPIARVALLSAQRFTATVITCLLINQTGKYCNYNLKQLHISVLCRRQSFLSVCELPKI